MDRLTTKQRIYVLKAFFKNNESPNATVRTLRDVFGRHRVPSESAARKLVQKFETTGFSGFGKSIRVAALCAD